MVPFHLGDGRPLEPGESDGHASGVSTLELALWAIALVALVADVALTLYGLSAGLVERNPVMRYALNVFGIGALFVGKAFAVGVALAVRVRWPQFALVPPLALAGPWLLAAGYNAALLSGV